MDRIFWGRDRLGNYPPLPSTGFRRRHANPGFRIRVFLFIPNEDRNKPGYP